MREAIAAGIFFLFLVTVWDLNDATYDIRVHGVRPLVAKFWCGNIKCLDAGAVQP